MRTGSRFCAFSMMFSLYPLLLHAQVNTGHNNQNITNNTGTVNQLNVRVQLQRAAKKAAIESTAWDRVLLPAGEPNPPQECEQEKTSSRPGKKSPQRLNVFLGSNQFFCELQSCVLVKVSPNDEINHNLLTAIRRGKLLLLSGKVFDRNGNIVAELTENVPKANRNEIYGKPLRIDKSTLKVLDNRGNTALFVHYRNASSIYLEGAFFQPQPVDQNISNPDGVVVTSLEMRVVGLDHSSGSRFRHACLDSDGEAGVEIRSTP